MALAGFRPFGHGVGAIHDRVAAIKPERVFQIIQTLAGRFIAAVDQPAIGLQRERPDLNTDHHSTNSSGHEVEQQAHKNALIKPVQLDSRSVTATGCHSFSAPASTV